jgi:hypothetical protein
MPFLKTSRRFFTDIALSNESWSHPKGQTRTANNIGSIWIHAKEMCDVHQPGDQEPPLDKSS